MARIRSIKPEFWTDPKIADLPKATALFFIALWNFADDQGIFVDDPRALSLQVPIYRSQDIDKMLNALWKAGLVLRSTIDGLVMIKGWHHQRIDRPRDGKWKDKEIKWMTWSESPKSRDQSTQGSDRIGEDRIGSDQGAKPKRSAKLAPVPIQPNLGRELVAYYCDVWAARYGTNPTILPKDAKALKSFAESSGLPRAKDLLRSYLEMHDSWFLTKTHDIQTFINNVAKVTQFADTGETISRGEIRQAETLSTNAATIRALREGKV